MRRDKSSKKDWAKKKEADGNRKVTKDEPQPAFRPQAEFTPAEVERFLAQKGMTKFLAKGMKEYRAKLREELKKKKKILRML